VLRGVARGKRKVVQPLRAAESKGHQNEYFKYKNNFLRSTVIKLFRNITENPINNYEFFEKHNFC
jgi:hypothetical protein